MSDVIDRDGFRANVGIVLMGDEGRLFLGRRTGGKGWQFPQGGMRQGESAEESLFRELHEEVGLAPADVELLGSTVRWLRYRLPERYVRVVSTRSALARSSDGSCCAWRPRNPVSVSTPPARRNSTAGAGSTTGSQSRKSSISSGRSM